MGYRKNNGCVGECCTLSATTRKSLFTSSSQCGKKEGHDQRAKQRQRMPELGVKSCIISSTRWKEPTKTKQTSVVDGVNYEAIDFPTPVKQIEKLEAENRNLAINVFGWENNCVIVHRLSKKEAEVPRINLMLIESGEVLRFIDSLNFLQGSLDSVVSVTPKESLKITSTIIKRPQTVLQKGDLPLQVHGLMGEIERDKAAGQGEVLQQAER